MGEVFEYTYIYVYTYVHICYLLYDIKIHTGLDQSDVHIQNQLNAAASQGSWISLTKPWVATYSVGGERPGMGDLFHRIACL